MREVEVEVGEVGELVLTNHSHIIFLGGFYFFFYFSLKPFPPFLHIIVVVSPVSCLLLIILIFVLFSTPFHSTGLCVNNEDFHLLRCMGEEEGVDFQVVYGR